MTAEKAFRKAVSELRAANIDDARFDCEALFTFCTGISKSARIMYPEAEPDLSAQNRFLKPFAAVLRESRSNTF